MSLSESRCDCETFFPSTRAQEEGVFKVFVISSMGCELVHQRCDISHDTEFGKLNMANQTRTKRYQTRSKQELATLKRSIRDGKKKRKSYYVTKFRPVITNVIAFWMVKTTTILNIGKMMKTKAASRKGQQYILTALVLGVFTLFCLVSLIMTSIPANYKVFEIPPAILKPVYSTDDCAKSVSLKNCTVQPDESLTNKKLEIQLQENKKNGMKCYTFKVLLEQLIGPGAYVTSIFVLGPAKTPVSYINKCNITALFLNSNISVPDDVFEHLLIDSKMCVKACGLQMEGVCVEEKERNDVCYIEDEPFHKWLTSNERMDTQSQPTPSFKYGFDLDEAATHQSCFLKRYGDVHVLGILHEKSLFIKSALDGTAPIINGFFQEEEYQSNLAASFETDINDSGLENDIKVKSAAGGDQSQTKEGSQPQRESPNHVGAAGDRSVRRRRSGNGIGGGGDGGKKPPGGGDSKRIGGCGGSPQQEQQQQGDQEENEAADVDRGGDVIQQEQQHQVHQEENEAADVDRGGDVIQQEQQQQADQEENETADVDRGGDVTHHNEAPVPNVDDGQDTHQDMQNPLILETRSIISTLQLHRLTAQHQCEIRFRVVQRGTNDDCIQILDPNNEMPDQYSEVAIRLDIPIHHCILDLETAVTTGALEKVKELLDKIKKRIFYCWICQQDVQPDELYNPALFYKCGHSFWDACRFAIRYCPVCREKRSCVLYLPEGFKRAFGLKDTTSKDMEDGVKRSVHVGIRLEEENAMVKVSRNHLLSTKADNGRVDKHQYPLPARQREVPRGPPDDIYIPPDPEFILPDRDGPEEAAGLDGRPPWNPRQALLNPEMSPVGPNLSPPYNYPIGDLPDYQTDNNRDAMQRYLLDVMGTAESPPESDEDDQPLGAEGGVSIEGVEASIQEEDGLSNEDLEEEEAHVEEEAKKDGHNREDSMRDSGVD